MRKLLAISIAVTAPLAGEVRAQAQPFKPVGPQSKWTIDLGGGAVYGFSPNGGNPDKVNAIPWASFNYRGRVYGDPLSGLGYNVVLRDRMIAGVQVRPHYGGKSNQLPGLEVPGLAADLGAYAFYRIGDKISVGGRFTQDISNVYGGNGLFLSAARQDITRIGMLQTTLYARYGDRKSNQAYYGVDNSEAATTGLHPYRLGAGLQSVGAAVLWAVPVRKRFVLVTFVNADQALGDVADSPLLQTGKKVASSYRAGVLLIRRFGSGEH
ncbi:MipA/OmpV family protein [Asticcacaulis excentricus]|uniref:MltA-interacting MipA family protein n=1 Tax=Asticcacaulis excentricus (strain ATCC 15261 / DSM 4724 / KCTC 12464 / NCIMB 9791 / VKM B-1370 / CB 48) TaxID=573065 RepID=E8RN96_ASTEC|nr:MipA/OmpV family protein [Asticcacaulis excentricus]ADU13995.1 MltA-interacting MipA family protein [Asticcacaulis excentricus CB 48]